jgi:hypothetical protein
LEVEKAVQRELTGAVQENSGKKKEKEIKNERERKKEMNNVSRFFG